MFYLFKYSIIFLSFPVFLPTNSFSMIVWHVFVFTCNLRCPCSEPIFIWLVTFTSVSEYLTCHNFQTKSEKEEHLTKIKNGDLDIIVGTHSLLGNRVVYNNLGLLVVDEEQVCQLSAINIFLNFSWLTMTTLYFLTDISLTTEVWCQAKGEDCFFQNFRRCSYSFCNSNTTNSLFSIDRFPRC